MGINQDGMGMGMILFPWELIPINGCGKLLASTHTRSQIVTPLVSCRVGGVLVKVKPCIASSVLAGRRCHEFLFDTHVAVNLRHIGLTTLVHFDEAMIHVSHCV